MLKITQIRIGEKMSTQHPRIPEQWIAPSWQLDFLSGSANDYRSEHGLRTRKRLEPIGQEWQDRLSSLKRHCVIRDDIYYQEALDLTIWQGGAVFGMLRYPAIVALPGAPEYELAEQYFVWMRRGDHYVGERLEIRLWGLYLPDVIAEGGNALDEIRAAPEKLLRNSEILAGRDTGYVALYLMQRPPTRVDVGRKTVSAIYEGENDAAKAALSRVGA